MQVRAPLRSGWRDLEHVDLRVFEVQVMQRCHPVHTQGGLWHICCRRCAARDLCVQSRADHRSAYKMHEDCLVFAWSSMISLR